MGQLIHDLGIDRLPVDERIALVRDIWDSVARDNGTPTLDEATRAELERRLAEDEASPDDVVDWETIKRDAQARWRR
ncbi:MAG: addiction module protein [Pseudomonadota bacterium]|nr:addiction module protein [Pseudomonadota bacterium]MDP1904609.1 addiction module protein [Pseudomonadota bacterium]MDP2353254.1 addiction module protein [Pseudomonadota bacterium]